MMQASSSPATIRQMIVEEYSKNGDPNPVQHTFQERLSTAFETENFMEMAVALEKAGDYFIETPQGVLSAVRLYQFAIYWLTRAKGQKPLSRLMETFAHDDHKFVSRSGSVPADIFYPEQLPAEDGQPDTVLPQSLRLLFKAGTATLIQDQFGSALDFFEKALKLCSVLSRHSAIEARMAVAFKIRVITNLGEVYRRMQLFEKAEKALQKAWSLARNSSDPSVKRKVLSVQASLKRDQGDWKRSEALFGAALTGYRDDISDLRGKVITMTGAGLLQLQRQWNEQALISFHAVRKFEEKIQDAGIWWAVYWGLGSCYLERRDYRQAYSCLIKSIEYLEKFQDNLRSDENKVTFIESTQFVYNKIFETLTGMYTEGDAPFSEMLNVMERGRAQSLRDLFGIGIQRPDWSEVKDYHEAAMLV